jgi:protein phosphatase
MRGYLLEYAVICNKGLIRDNNQDNFWCEGRYLEAENNGLKDPICNITDSTKQPIFAVFDGMGGEKSGEQAAWLAANSLEEICATSRKNRARKGETFLSGACDKMNQAICAYASGHHIQRMGTTAAMLMFARDRVFVCNLGDSRIFLIRDGSLTQISRDHIASRMSGRKPLLTQHLGIPDSEFRIEPYLTQAECRIGDRYLICSDGVTDMLSVDEIAMILSTAKDAHTGALTLQERALDAGGRDNITAVVCHWGGANGDR